MIFNSEGGTIVRTAPEEIEYETASSFDLMEDPYEKADELRRIRHAVSETSDDSELAVAE